MSDFNNATVVREANIYFDGKVMSRAVVFEAGTKSFSCCAMNELRKALS